MSSVAPVTRSRNVNRAEVVDANFSAHVRALAGVQRQAISATAAVLPGSRLTVAAFLELFESQQISRHLDLMARVLRVRNKVFYTIGSAGHEGNAMVARATRHTDPAFLHYRSGAFMAERFRKLPGMDPIYDSALSFAASEHDPASGGRHKVWGSKALWVLPQTSTIGSHPPKAFGTALAIDQAKRMGVTLPIPDDSLVVCSFGDASANHSTVQGAVNAIEWAAYQGLKVPLLIVCEDNGIGISVRSPKNWIGQAFSARRNLHYVPVNGLDLAEGYANVEAAVDFCRRERKPVFLHVQTCRLMGHAGTDFEIEYLSLDEVEANEARDPLLRSASIAIESGALTAEAVLALYEDIRKRCFAAADRADQTPKLLTKEAVMAPLAPYTVDAVNAEAVRADYADRRLAQWGSAAALPENQAPKHLAIQINQALHDLMLKYPQSLLFGEDVAQKGGVYTVTKGLFKSFKGARVFNTLLDEQTILGLAQGFANLGLLPIPEIQYLAYYHNACDQIRGEAASLQFFSNGQYRNPMLLRVAGLGYQRGFGGHFHNDNSFAALRDIPGLVIACPSRGDDAAMMLRTLMAMCHIDGRVVCFLEPIALYMTKDLYAAGDNQWCFPYPAPDQAIPYLEGRVYKPDARSLLIITYGNGVLMSLKAAAEIESKTQAKVRVLDLRWIQPINEAQIVANATDCERILIVDEGRRSASVGEAIITALVEGGQGGKPISRVVGEDCYTPLAGAANLVLPSEASVQQAALRMLLRG
jgi:2-oxoisovalerate dehydrogenase E1 component